MTTRTFPRLMRICVLALATILITGCGGGDQNGGEQDGDRQSDAFTLTPSSGPVATEVNWSPPCDEETSALVEFGPVGIAPGSGRSVFEVPPVSPDVYQVKVWCGPATDANLLGTVEFTVTSG